MSRQQFLGEQSILPVPATFPTHPRHASLCRLLTNSGGLQIAITEAQMRNGPVNDLDLLAFGQRRKGRKFKGGRVDGLGARAGTRHVHIQCPEGNSAIGSHPIWRHVLRIWRRPSLCHPCTPFRPRPIQRPRLFAHCCQIAIYSIFFSSHFTRKPKPLRQKKPLASYLYPTMTGGQARGVQDVAVLLQGAQEEQKEGLD